MPKQPSLKSVEVAREGINLGSLLAVFVGDRALGAMKVRGIWRFGPRTWPLNADLRTVTGSIAQSGTAARRVQTIKLRWKHEESSVVLSRRGICHETGVMESVFSKVNTNWGTLHGSRQSKVGVVRCHRNVL